MTSFDFDSLNLNLLPVQEGSLDAPTVETNFREMSEAIQVLKQAVQNIRDLLSIPTSLPLISLDPGRFIETFTASSSRVVNHGLGLENPQVIVYRSDGRQIYTVVTNVDVDTVRLDFIGTLTDAIVAVDFAQT